MEDAYVVLNNTIIIETALNIWHVKRAFIPLKYILALEHPDSLRRSLLHVIALPKT